MEKVRTGFTKTGFSKAGFGCCGRFKYCEMGKKECFYLITDPEVQEYCAAFQRVNNGRVFSMNNKTALVPAALPKTITKEVVVDFAEGEKGQLSLF